MAEELIQLFLAVIISSDQKQEQLTCKMMSYNVFVNYNWN